MPPHNFHAFHSYATEYLHGPMGSFCPLCLLKPSHSPYSPPGTDRTRFQLEEVELLPIATSSGTILDKKVLYELYPSDPRIRFTDDAIIPFYRTTIVHNLPLNGSVTQRINNLKSSLRGKFVFDYIWCPKTGENKPRESAFIVCYNAKMAARVLEYILQIRDYERELTAEIHAPYPYGPLARRKRIEDWSHVMVWVQLVGDELRLIVGLRELELARHDRVSSWLLSVDDSWTTTVSENGDVMLWLTSPGSKWAQEWHGDLERVPEIQRIDSVTDVIAFEIRKRMIYGRHKVGLKLVFKQDNHRKTFERWLDRRVEETSPHLEVR